MDGSNSRRRWNRRESKGSKYVGLLHAYIDMPQIVNIEVYNRRDQIHGKNDRLKEYACRLNPQEIVSREIATRGGQMMISGKCGGLTRTTLANAGIVSAAAPMRDQVRKIVLAQKDPCVTLHNSPFQPFETQTHQQSKSA